jgi:hypothetical protein
MKEEIGTGYYRLSVEPEVDELLLERIVREFSSAVGTAGKKAASRSSHEDRECSESKAEE